MTEIGLKVAPALHRLAVEGPETGSFRIESFKLLQTFSQRSGTGPDRLIGFTKLLESVLPGLKQAGGVGGAAMLQFQFSFLVGAETRGINFRNLVTQKFELPLIRFIIHHQGGFFIEQAGSPRGQAAKFFPQC